MLKNLERDIKRRPKMNDYSYQEIVEDGISVCASCGNANINFNKPRPNKNLDMSYCFDCDYAEGTMTCMPNDLYFYQEAKETLNKINKGEL